MDADCNNGREPVVLSSGGHLALSTIPEASTSESDDPDLRPCVSPDVPGYEREPPTTVLLPFGGNRALDPNSVCRAANPERAVIPRTCLVCGETAPSGISFFANHLNAAYEYLYTRASLSDSSGADSGPGANGLDEDADNANGSDEDGDAAVGSNKDADYSFLSNTERTTHIHLGINRSRI